MKKRNRWMRRLAFLTIAVLMISMLPVNGFNVSAAVKTANISGPASQLSVQAGSTVTVPVILSDNPGIMGMGLNVSYDKDVLTPAFVEATGLTSEGTYDDSIETSGDNTFKIVWAHSENMTENGTIFNITFIVSGDAEGDTTIDLSYSGKDTFDEDFEQVKLNCSPITVNVTAKAPSVTTLRGPSGLNVNDGEEFDVPIIIDKPSGVSNLNFRLEYDGDAFSYVSYKAGLATGNGISAAGAKGVAAVSVSGLDSSVSTGTLLTLRFKASEYQGGDFTFNLISSDVATKNFKIKITNTHESENAIVYGGKCDLDETTLTVPVMIKNNHGVAAFRMTLSYDASVLTPVSVKKDNRLSGNLNHTIGDTPGAFDVLWTGTDNITHNGTLYTVQFTVKDLFAKTTNIGLDYTPADTCDEDANDVFFDMEDINVTLKEPDPEQPALQSISATKAKTVYSLGESLNTDDMVVTAEYEDGSTSEVSGWTTNASNIDMSNSGEKTLTVTYTEREVTKTFDLTITVHAELTSITATKVKTEYDLNETLNTDDITVTASYSDGTSREVTGWTSDADSFDMSVGTGGGIRYLRIYYEENSISVMSTVGIIVRTKPIGIKATKQKVNYETGDTLNVDDLTVLIGFEDNAWCATMPAPYGLNGTGYITNADTINMDTPGSKVLTVSYTLYDVTVSTDIDITVTSYDPENPSLQSISAEKETTQYFIGDSLDLNDLVITAHYSDGTSREVSDYTTNQDEIDMGTVGYKSLLISYTEDEDTMMASVTLNVTAKLERIKLSKAKKEYYIGSGIDTDDLIVTAVYSDGTNREVYSWQSNEEDIITSTAGDKSLIVTYTENGITKEASLTIKIVPFLQSIIVEKIKTIYNLGDELNTDDLRVTAVYSDGTRKVDVIGYTVNTDGIDMNTEGTKTIVVSYAEYGRIKSSSVKINVVNPDAAKLDSISVSKAKTTYYQYEDLDFNDLVVTAHYTDGSSKVVSNYRLQADEVGTYDVGTQRATVSYSENGITRTETVTIIVKAPISLNKATVKGLPSFVYSKTIKKRMLDQRAKITVTLDGEKLVYNRDYWIEYCNALTIGAPYYNVGRSFVYINGMGKYEGEILKTVKIAPAGTKLKKLTRGKKSFTAKWTRQTAKMSKERITGYQIRYSLKKTMKSSKKVKIKGYKKTSRKIKKLKARKTYYVQIRTYKVISGVTVYSKWSAKKKVRTK